jgi:hypothetical protein
MSAGYCWLLLVTAGYCWLLLVIAGYRWLSRPWTDAKGKRMSKNKQFQRANRAAIQVVVGTVRLTSAVMNWRDNRVDR